jgi:hypothetical protein
MLRICDYLKCLFVLNQTPIIVGIGGAVGSGTPRPIPDPLYLAAKPAFFGPNRWPWVDPSNGTVTILPAKARLEQEKMPTCMM